MEAPVVQTSVPWLDARGAAEYLGVSLRTIQNWTSDRQITSYAAGKVIRYHRRDLDAFMERHRRPAV